MLLRCSLLIVLELAPASEAQSPEPRGGDPSRPEDGMHDQPVLPDPTEADQEATIAPESGTSARHEDAPSMQALELAAMAQLRREDGALTDAMTLVDQAIDLAPGTASLYLMRAQIALELGRALGANGGASHYRAAIADLEHYLSHEALDDATRRSFERRRDDLADQLGALELERAEAQRLEQAPREQPQTVADHRAPAQTTVAPRPDLPARKFRPGPWWTLAGSVLAAGSAAAGATSVRLERRCAATCSSRPTVVPQSMAVAASLSAASSGLLGYGVYRLARDAPPRVARRIVIATSILSGLALSAGIVTAGLWGHHWSRVRPSDRGGLSTTQSLANAAVASFAIAVPLGSATLGGLLGSVRAKRRHRITARIPR